MFTLSILGLISSYILIALLLLSINLYSRWSWQIKAATVIITTLFYIINYVSFPPLLGWPTRQSPPENFELIAAHVLQPDKMTGSDGAIYLWLAEITDLDSNNPPRAYEFPYSEGMHERVIKAKTKLDQGKSQLGEFQKPETGVIRQLKNMQRLGQESINIQFYDTPDPMFPDK